MRASISEKSIYVGRFLRNRHFEIGNSKSAILSAIQRCPHALRRLRACHPAVASLFSGEPKVFLKAKSFVGRIPMGIRTASHNSYRECGRNVPRQQPILSIVSACGRKSGPFKLRPDEPATTFWGQKTSFWKRNEPTNIWDKCSTITVTHKVQAIVQCRTSIPIV